MEKYLAKKRSSRRSEPVRLASRILKGLLCLIQPEQEGLTDSIKYQPDFPYLMADPRINFLKRTFELIVPLCDIKSAAFRLRDLENWRIKMGIPTFLNQMAWSCRTDCLFCYQKGNPPFMKTKYRMPKEEIKTRLKYFKRDTGLIGPVQHENDETLNNPYIKEILRGIRRKSREIILITTNGTSLTPEMIRVLKKAKPIFLAFSLNSADPKYRKWLMNDPHPEIAIQSLPLLKKARIPYLISIVAWPGLPFEDIERTIKYANRFDAFQVRICLPAYSRYFSVRNAFNVRRRWLRTIHFVDHLKNKYSVPILHIPPEFGKKTDLPFVIGAIKNSPAHEHGVKPGDLIREINGQKVDSTEKTMAILTGNLGMTIEAKLECKNRLYTLKMRDRGAYPYLWERLQKAAPFGFLLRREQYLSEDDVKDIRRYVILHNAKKVLVLTSSIMRPILKHKMEKLKLFKLEKIKVKLGVVKNHFYGGSIETADLLVVEDFVRAIKQQAKKDKPDLVILPASPFNQWGRDLTGRVNLDIEREVDIPVEFIYNQGSS